MKGSLVLNDASIVRRPSNTKQASLHARNVQVSIFGGCKDTRPTQERDPNGLLGVVKAREVARVPAKRLFL